MKLFNSLITAVGACVLIVILVIALSHYRDSSAQTMGASIINFSAFPQLDFENVSWFAVDQFGNKVNETEYFGVNGVFTREQPLIFGPNEYAYWVDSQTHFVEPTILAPDIYHQTQSVSAKAFKTQDPLKLRLRVIDLLQTYYAFNEIKFHPKDEFREIAQFEVEYRSHAESFLPFGGVIVLEFENAPIIDIQCDIPARRVPDSFRYRDVTTDAEAWELSRGFDEGDWRFSYFTCEMQKRLDTSMNISTLYLTVIPYDYYITSQGQMKLDVDDERGERVRSWIKEVAIDVT